MDLTQVKSSLENQKESETGTRNDRVDGGDDDQSRINSLPHRFYEPFIMQGIKLASLEPGRIVFSFTVPPRLVNRAGNAMHYGAMATLVDFVGAFVGYTMGVSAGVSVEVNTSFYDIAHLGEEIDIDARALLFGKVLCVVNVELRNKKTKKLLAQGRHTLYMAVPSKL